MAPARVQAKRRQRCVRAELWSAAKYDIWSAETLYSVEGNTGRASMVRTDRAPRRRRTQARTYVIYRDLGGLRVVPVYGWDRIGKARGRKPMMYGPKKSDMGIVAEKPANKAVRAVAELAEPRPVTNGNSRALSTDRTRCRSSVYQAAERIRRSSGPRSLPEVGAVCVSAHVRICAGGAGQPAFLPRTPATPVNADSRHRWLRIDRAATARSPAWSGRSHLQDQYERRQTSSSVEPPLRQSPRAGGGPLLRPSRRSGGATASRSPVEFEAARTGAAARAPPRRTGCVSASPLASYS